MLYKENYYQLIILLLPTFLRKKRTLSFFSALVFPLKSLAETTLYQMQHDGRVIYLEKVLNEYFLVEDYDATDHHLTKKIIIEDVAKEPRLYVFLNLESEVVYLDDGEFMQNSYDPTFHFVVKIPVGFMYDIAMLNYLINFYKLAGKRYLIINY